MVSLAGQALNAFINRQPTQTLPHEMLLDNLVRESVRFASRTLEALEQAAKS